MKFKLNGHAKLILKNVSFGDIRCAWNFLNVHKIWIFKINSLLQSDFIKLFYKRILKGLIKWSFRNGVIKCNGWSDKWYIYFCNNGVIRVYFEMYILF